MTNFSSWGPVDDGRIKPEVVAAGCESNGTGGLGITSTNLTNAYRNSCGTSMATPAVSGTVALLLQEYHAIHSTMPPPAAVKALLIHTARDLGRPGPDYVFGYGLVDAQRAADAIRARQISGRTIQSNSQVDTARLDVRTSIPEIRVTLAWDDQAAAANAAQTLINDLDLRLIAPNGQAQEPFVLNAQEPANNAGRGVDRVNVVEQVVVEGPQHGNWQVEVRGTRLAQGPQRYAVLISTDRSGILAPVLISVLI